MEQDAAATDRRALPVIALGVLVAAVPLLLFSSAGDGGPITFVFRMIQSVAALGGVSVAGIGYYSYRTGALRPAATVGLSIVGLALVGAIGGLIELSSGRFVPVPVWLLAAAGAIGGSATIASRCTDDNSSRAG
ncbi:hypothetical protein [Natrinema marinum]|uniref:hypothetical protein n=1 Tax=Natrinema marinum TaxID=2961598 RepID=UPI0020C8EF43|nr:hypothetical protein [Natrinema marinum]